MPKLLCALFVGLLSLTASGVTAVAIGERCSAIESSRGSDSTCPPTCATCGCCAQAAEPMVMHIAVSPLVTGPALPDVRPFDLLTPNPRDVLHVPKAHPAAN